MTRDVGKAIYNLIEGAITEIANDFFIAGYDYDWRLSHPDHDPPYKASFFDREDTILASDIHGHVWKRLYSPTEGLGRINRNYEGIPTATFWPLDFSDAQRDVVSYQLDDGTEIFIRVPVEWWENYEITTLGNNRTDPDRTSPRIPMTDSGGAAPTTTAVTRPAMSSVTGRIRIRSGPMSTRPSRSTASLTAERSTPPSRTSIYRSSPA
jgi:hypothetical protein